MPAHPTAERPTVFINARLIDPATERDEPGGLLVREGKIADIGPHLRRNAPEGAAVVDCKGHVLCPGLVDMQVFTGEPGYEHRETLKTASLAAAAGGVTTIVVMPDTNPVIDQVALVDFIQRRARDNAVVHVHTMAAMTQAASPAPRSPRSGSSSEAGADRLQQRASRTVDERPGDAAARCTYAKRFPTPSICSPYRRTPDLSEGLGVMNSGRQWRVRLGLSGRHQARGGDDHARARPPPRRGSPAGATTRRRSHAAESPGP
jgi:dihydroorotase